MTQLMYSQKYSQMEVCYLFLRSICQKNKIKKKGTSGNKHDKSTTVIINGYIAHIVKILIMKINDYETSQDDNFFNPNNVSHFM